MKRLGILRPVNRLDPPEIKAKFPEEAFKHSGRMRVSIIEDLFDRHKDHIEVVGEPLIGTGSVCIAAAPRGITVVGCEYEQRWVDVAREVARNSNCQAVIWQGDSIECPPTLLQKFDTLLTSPPFPNAHCQGKSKMQKNLRDERSTFAGNDFALNEDWGCGSTPNRYKWVARLRQLLNSWVPGLVKGGLVLIHIKDFVRQGERVDVGDWVANAMQGAGLTPQGYYLAPLTYTSGFQEWLKYERKKVVMWKTDQLADLECGHSKLYNKPPKKKPEKCVCTSCPKEDWIEVKEEKVILGWKL